MTVDAGGPTTGRRPMLVQQVSLAAQDVVTLRLVDPDGRRLAPWQPGAHLDVYLPSGLIRQYSLCGPAEDELAYTVAVARAQQSRGGSTEIHNTGLVGRTIDVRGPRNHFPLRDASHIILVAGGIGITPILAMARALSRAGREFTLLYGGRTRAEMAFFEECKGLLGEVHLAPQDEQGLPDIRGIMESAPSSAVVQCCGPEGMMRAVEEECRKRGLPLYTERFLQTGRAHSFSPGSGPPGTLWERPEDGSIISVEPPIKAEEPDEARVATFEVELARSHLTLPVPPDRSILEVVREHVPDVASSCEEGFCGTCETRVLGGTPEHRDSILTDEERAAGETMMICVGRSKSPRLTLDL